mmetsp:Transcript_52868/g.149901  ORF Transcript_52868/g.149901 Transcript_52868/m.149901 type:complete len:171 (+) Transcript_52868:61-573(+)
MKVVSILAAVALVAVSAFQEDCNSTTDKIVELSCLSANLAECANRQCMDLYLQGYELCTFEATGSYRMIDGEYAGLYTGPTNAEGKADGIGKLAYDDGYVFLGNFVAGEYLDGVFYFPSGAPWQTCSNGTQGSGMIELCQEPPKKCRMISASTASQFGAVPCGAQQVTTR